MYKALGLLAVRESNVIPLRSLVAVAKRCEVRRAKVVPCHRFYVVGASQSSSVASWAGAYLRSLSTAYVPIWR